MSGLLGAAGDLIGGAGDLIGAASAGELLGAGVGIAGFAAQGGGAWRARMRQAAFRGARFFVEEMSGESGRRLANHEYPGRDLPFSEDLGRKQRRWTFTAYTLGPLYTVERDLLVEACEDKGPASLVHPSIGIVNVCCETIAFNESRDRGGYCQFSLTFIESGKQAQPTGLMDTIAFITTMAAQVDEAVQIAFKLAYSLGLPTAPAQRGVADVVKLADTIDFLRRPVYGVSQSELVRNIAALRIGAPLLVAQPEQLALRSSETVAAYTEASDADAALAGLLDVAMGFRAHTGGGMPLHQTEEANATAFQSYVRELALRDIGYTIPAVSLVSTDQAEMVRDQVVEAFTRQEEVAANSGEDEVYKSLGELRIAILLDIDRRESRLPSLVPYRTPRSINAITLAWSFYQDANRDLDLVERVHAITPGFMPIEGRVLDR